MGCFVLKKGGFVRRGRSRRCIGPKIRQTAMTTSTALEEGQVVLIWQGVDTAMRSYRRSLEGLQEARAAPIRVEGNKTEPGA